tara:strand:+ start:264 stop:503 length:240 start_codon:yes stop_codon:yes gene_type:complete
MEKPVFEKGIPVPAESGYRLSKYYWVGEMEVGDSFPCTHKQYNAIRQLTQGERAPWLPEGFKLETRKIENGVYRIWRTA